MISNAVRIAARLGQVNDDRTVIGERIRRVDQGPYYSNRVKVKLPELEIPFAKNGRILPFEIRNSLERKQLKMLSKANAILLCDLAKAKQLTFVHGERLVILTEDNEACFIWGEEGGLIKSSCRPLKQHPGWLIGCKTERFVFDALFSFHVVGGTNAPQ